MTSNWDRSLTTDNVQRLCSFEISVTEKLLESKRGISDIVFSVVLRAHLMLGLSPSGVAGAVRPPGASLWPWCRGHVMAII